MLTYESCTNLIKNRDSKKLANNTYLKKDGDNFTVTLHDTVIVIVLPNSSLILNSGGYVTKTTKSRLNEYVGNKIQQKNSIWYIDGIPFYDGIVIDKDGKLFNPIDNTEKVEENKKKLDKLVKEYINGYIDWALKNGVERSNGDCWMCLFGQHHSLYHVYQHLVESYYFGSFLDTAISGGGFTPVWRSLIESELQRNNSSSLRRVLTSYFRKMKTKLLEFM